jgi:hypothetical protein
MAEGANWKDKVAVGASQYANNPLSLWFDTEVPQNEQVRIPLCDTSKPMPRFSLSAPKPLVLPSHPHCQRQLNVA